MPRPSALRVVGWLFIASGVLAVISTAGDLLIEKSIRLDIDLLGLWIGPGLLRHEERSRTWALRLLVVGFFLAPIAALLLIFQPRPIGLRFFNIPTGTIPLPIALGTLALMVAVSIWEYWVLSRSAARALFAVTPIDDREASV